MFDADIGVVGLGAIGSMTLRQLAARGADVLGLEQFWIPHDRGAAGGDTRLFRSLPYLELHEGDVRIMADAVDAWRDLEAESGAQLLIRSGGVCIGSAGTPAMQRVARIADERGAAAEVLRAGAARERLPAHRLHADDLVVWDHEGGLIRSELAVDTAVRMARRHGARVEQCSKVLGWTSTEGGVEVRTTDRTFRFRRLVVATGAWANDLLEHVPVTPRRILLSWFMPEDPTTIARFRPDVFPSFIRADGPEFLYGGPTTDDVMVKVAGVYPWEDPARADELDRSVTEGELEGIRHAVRTYFDGLSDAPSRVSVYQDGWSRDDTALVGPWPAAPDVIVAVGFSGYGFKICPVIGAIAADLALEGSTDYDIDHLRPERF